MSDRGRRRDDRERGRKADREEPVGEPVVRADPAITGERAREAVGFDPDDPESVERAAWTVRAFADASGTEDDNVFMLRGAAACAALVRGVGSYKAASERTDGVPITFIRKWARVHDLPQAIRRHVARGDIAPTAAKHIARVSGTARFDLAWATLDGDLTVRQIRKVASRINEGTPVATALAEHGVTLGELTLSLPPATYRELRRRASMENRDPGEVVAEALAEHLEVDDLLAAGE
ncbi:MAG: hypothetical protein ABEJ28_13070 [Salinigranum sp.]